MFSLRPLARTFVLSFLVASTFSSLLSPVTFAAPPPNNDVEVFLLDQKVSIKPGQVSDSKFVLKEGTTNTYLATFGYDNKNTTEITIDSASSNYFTPKSEFKTQTTYFKTGRVDNAFTAELFCGTKLSWTVIPPNGKPSTAKVDAPRCGALLNDSNGNPLPSSSCENPEGWIEDETGQTQTSTNYFIPKSPYIPTSHTPKDNPDSFKTASCGFTQKIRYIDPKDGNKLKTVDNAIILLDALNDTNTKDGKEIKDTKQAKKDGYKYVNKGNDFRAYFPENPNSGWKFENDGGESITVTKVSISGKPLTTSPNQVVIDKNTITYKNILPSIDLQYQVDNTGVSKFFILRDKTALSADLSKIEFEIKSDKKLTKSNPLKEQITTETDTKTTAKGKQTPNSKVLKKIRNKASGTANTPSDDIKNEDITSQIDSLNEIKTTTKPEDENDKTKKADKQLKKDLVDQKVRELNKLKDRITKGEILLTDQAKISEEITKIEERGSQLDRIKLGDEKGVIKVSTPVTYDKKFSGISNDTFTISQDGKLITLYPNQEYLASTDREFPIVIDPRFDSGQFGAVADTTVLSGQPSSNRGGDWWGGVGGNLCITIVTGNCPSSYIVGDARSLLSFNFPNSFSAISRVEDARVTVKQYAHNGGDFSARVLRLNGNYSEYGTTWTANYPDANAADQRQGNISLPIRNFGYTNPGQEWTTSSNIAALVDDSKNAGGIFLEFRDPDESTNRGAIFCSRNGGAAAGHPCQNGDQGPRLQVIFTNGDPKKPNPISPDNSDIVGGCNLSETPTAGICSPTLTRTFEIQNVDDGNGVCSNTAMQLNLRDPFYQVTGWNGWYNKGEIGGCGRDNKFWDNITLSNGIQEYRAYSKDISGNRYSTVSDTRKFTVDTSPPVRTGQFPNKEFSKNNQIELNSPDTGDNLLNRYTVSYFGAGRLFSSANLSLQVNPSLAIKTASTTIGSTLNLQTTDSSSNFKWYIDNFIIRSDSDRTTCLDISARDIGAGVLKKTVGSEVRIATNCTGTNSQKWIVTGLNQLKSQQADEVNTTKDLCISPENGDQNAGAKILVRNCDTTENGQRWIINSLSPSPKNIDANPNTSDLTIVDATNGNQNQIVVIDSFGQLKFRGLNGGLCGDSAAGGTENSRLYVYSGHCTGASNQKFFYNPETREIKMNNENWCVNVPNGIITSGTSLKINSCSGSLSQKWEFNKIAEPIRIALKDRAKSLHLDASDGYEARVFDSNQMIQQQLSYDNSNNQIKTATLPSPFCLEAGVNQSGNVVSGNLLNSRGCDISKSNQKWIFTTQGQTKLKDTNLCISFSTPPNDVWNVVNDTRVVLSDCNNLNWTQRLSPQPLSNFTGNGIIQQYNYQVSKDANFSNPANILDLGWQTSPVLQYPNDPNFNNLWYGEIKVTATTNGGTQAGKGLHHPCVDSSCGVAIFGANPTQDQRWIYTKNQELRSANSPYQCLDAKTSSFGDKVYTSYCHGGDNQKWIFDSGMIKLKQLDGGNTQMCLDVSGGNYTIDWTALQVWGCNNSDAQQFTSQKITEYNQTQYWLSEGQKYYTRLRLKDRAEGLSANTSAWQYFDGTTIDSTSPKVDNFSISNPVFVPPAVQIQKRGVVDVASNTTATFEVTEKNLDNVKVNILGQGNLRDFGNQTPGASDEVIKILDKSNSNALNSTYSQLTFNGQLYQFKTENDQLYQRRSLDGVSWITSNTAGQTTDGNGWRSIGSNIGSNAQAVVLNKKLYLVIREKSSSKIITNSSGDGINWGAWTAIGALTTPNEPSAIVFDNQIFVTVRSATDNAIQTAVGVISGNSVSFGGFSFFGGVSQDKITQNVLDGRLFQTVRSDGNLMYVRSSSNGTGWTNWNNYTGGTTYKPIDSITYKGKLIQAMTSSDSAANLHNRTVDVNGASSYQYVQIATDYPVSFQIYQDTLYQRVIEKGSSPLKIQSRATTDGTNWTGWSEISELTSLVKPVTIDRQSKVVKTITSCNKPNTLSLPLPCNGIAFTRDANDKVQISVSWDGLNDLGLVSPDGVYTIDVKAYDKAGNESYNLAGNNYVAIDTQPLDINISYPKVGGWVNTPNPEITGGLVTRNGGNNNFGSLKINKTDLDGAGTNSNGFNDKTVNVTVANNPNFVLNKDASGTDTKKTYLNLAGLNISNLLDKGKNTFNFTVDDNLKNTGTSTNSINFEDTRPQIVSIVNQAQYNQKDFPITFKVKDVRVGADDSQTSGMNLGNNPSGYDISILQSTDEWATFKELPLFRDGQPVTDPYSQKRLADNLVCKYSTPATTPTGQTTPNTNNRSDEVSCGFDVKELSVEGYYKFYIKAQDTAGNEICSNNYNTATKTIINPDITCGSANTGAGNGYQAIDQAFALKTINYLTLENQDGQLIDNTTTIKGTTERWSDLTIANQTLGKAIKITVDTAKNNVLPAEYDSTVNTSPTTPLLQNGATVLGAITVPEGQTTGSFTNVNNGVTTTTTTNRTLTYPNSPIKFVCGKMVDHDNNPQTANKEMCDFELKVKLVDNSLPAITSSTNPSKENTIRIEDSSWGSTTSLNRKLAVDLNTINLFSSPSATIFSPNGDGVQDAITFNNLITQKNQVPYVVPQTNVGNTTWATWAVDTTTSVELNPNIPGEYLVRINVKNKNPNIALNDNIVFFEFYNPSGVVETNRFTEHNAIATNSSKDFTFSFNPLTVGQYQIKMGVFTSTWGSVYWEDQILKFTKEATTNPSTIIEATQGDYRAELRDTQNRLVWQYPSPALVGTPSATNFFGSVIAPIPQSVVLTGRINVDSRTAPCPNQVGPLGLCTLPSAGALYTTLPDATYTYSFKVKTASGKEYTAPSVPIVVANNLPANSTPIVSTPKTGYVTTKGIVVVQGQAPSSEADSVTTTTNTIINGVSTPTTTTTQNKSARKWNTTICLDEITTVNPNGDGICEVTGTTRTNSTGFYSTILNTPVLPVNNPNTPNNTKTYSLTVKATDNAGLTTPTAQGIKVVVEPNQTLTATSTSNLASANTQEELSAFITQTPITLTRGGNISTLGNPGTTTTGSFVPSLKDLKYITFSLKVDTNTEAADIDLVGNVQASNTTGTTTNDVDYNPTPIKRIASLNRTTESDLKLNPSLDQTNKKNQRDILKFTNSNGQYYKSAKELGYLNKCEAGTQGFDPNLFGSNVSGCTWTYNYLLGQDADVSAGQYQARIRSYKGETIKDQYTTFEVSGIKPYIPAILKLERQSLKEDQNCYKQESINTDGCKEWKVATKLTSPVSPNSPNLGGATGGGSQTTYYTNSNIVRLYGASDSESIINLKITDPSNNNQVIYSTATPTTTTVNGITTTNNSETTTSNGAGVFTNTITLPELADGSEKTYDISLSTNLPDDTTNSCTVAGIPNQKCSTTYATTTYKLKYDRKTPDLSWVQTQTASTINPFSTSPWIHGGDPVAFTIKTNEEVNEVSVLNEVGFDCMARKGNNTLIVGGQIQSNCDPESASNRGDGTVQTTNSPIGKITNPIDNSVVDCSIFTPSELKSGMRNTNSSSSNSNNQSSSLPYICHYTYLSQTTHTALLTINSSTEKIIYPSIYLEDLSGNKTLITNNTTKQTDLQTILKATRPNSPKGYLGSIVKLGTSKTIDSTFLYSKNPSEIFTSVTD